MPSTAGRLPSGRPLWTTVCSCGTPVFDAVSSPSHPQPVPDAAPHHRPSPPAPPRALLCPCRAPRRRHTRWRRVLNLQPTSEGVLPGSAPRAGHPGRLHRRRALQDPRRQRPAGQPRPAPGRAGPAHPLQLPARGPTRWSAS